MSALRPLMPVVLVLSLSAACSKDSPPVSPVTADVSSAHLAATAADETHLVVVKTQEIDENGDGSIDTRSSNTAWHDAHGNPVKDVYERFAPGGGVESRDTYSYEYNQHGNVIGYSIDHDAGADGTIENRTVSTTVERDRHGNPTSGLWSWDAGADGTIDNQAEWSSEFDAKGNLVREVWGSETRTMAYDAHGNRILFQTGTLEVTSKYSSRNALIHEVEDWGAFGLVTLTTTDYERGNPVQQEKVATNTAGTIERTVFTMTYDNRHRRLTHVEETDGYPFGNTDRRATISYRYVGNGEARHDSASPAAWPMPSTDPILTFERASRGDGARRE